MGLVTAKKLQKAINAEKYGVLGTFSGWLFKALKYLSSINFINKHLKDVDFLNAILDDLQKSLKSLKILKAKEGAYITISNHPLGGIDGSCWNESFFSKLYIELSLSKYIMPVNPFEITRILNQVLGLKKLYVLE
jgi:hypothetical protein